MIILGYVFMKTCYGYSLEAQREGTSNEYPQHMFLWRNLESYPKSYPRVITKYCSLASQSWINCFHIEHFSHGSVCVLGKSSKQTLLHWGSITKCSE